MGLVVVPWSAFHEWSWLQARWTWFGRPSYTPAHQDSSPPDGTGVCSVAGASVDRRQPCGAPGDTCSRPRRSGHDSRPGRVQHPLGPGSSGGSMHLTVRQMSPRVFRDRRLATTPTTTRRRTTPLTTTTGGRVSTLSVKPKCRSQPGSRRWVATTATLKLNPNLSGMNPSSSHPS